MNGLVVLAVHCRSEFCFYKWYGTRLFILSVLRVRIWSLSWGWAESVLRVCGIQGGWGVGGTEWRVGKCPIGQAMWTVSKVYSPLCSLKLILSSCECVLKMSLMDRWLLSSFDVLNCFCHIFITHHYRFCKATFVQVCSRYFDYSRHLPLLLLFFPPAISVLLTCPTYMYNFRNPHEILDLQMKENVAFIAPSWAYFDNLDSISIKCLDSWWCKPGTGCWIIATGDKYCKRTLYFDSSSCYFNRKLTFFCSSLPLIQNGLLKRDFLSLPQLVSGVWPRWLSKIVKIFL